MFFKPNVSRRALFIYVCAISIIIYLLMGLVTKVKVKEEELPPKLSCTNVHIGTIFFSNADSFNFYIMLKSIFYYRDVALTFHVIVDDRSENTVKTLFAHWNTLTDVTVITYNVEQNHTNFCLLLNKDPQTIKYLFPSMVQDVPQIIVLDSDLFVIGNIRLLCTIYNKMDTGESVTSLKNDNSESELLIFAVEKFKISDDYKITNCNASIQQSTNLKSDKTLSNLIRWEYINKIRHNQSSDYINSIYNLISQLHSTLLPTIGKSLPQPVLNISKECSKFPEIAGKRYPYRRLLFLKKFYYVPKKSDVTLVTVVTFDKMLIFELTCERWEGPISVSIYTDDIELHLLLKFVENSLILSKRQNIAYHILFRNSAFLPLNTLRNIAFKNVNTPYLLLIDVDLVPGNDLYNKLLNYLKDETNLERKVLVVPSFQISDNQEKVAINISELQEMWNQNKVKQFQFPYMVGQEQTNYQFLKTASKPYTVQYKPLYEPFVVMEFTAPEFDERFFGYALNRVQHVLELVSANYEFVVLPDTFLIHKPHKRTKDANVYYKSKEYKACMVKLGRNFLLEMNVKYNCNYSNTHFDYRPSHLKVR